MQNENINNSVLLGEGTYGRVEKAVLDGIPVAAKTLKLLIDMQVE